MGGSRRAAAARDGLIGFGAVACLGVLALSTVREFQLGNTAWAASIAVGALLALLVGLLVASRASRAVRTLSSDVSALSARVRRLETSIREPEPDLFDVAELATDVAGLSRVTRDLAERLATYEAATPPFRDPTIGRGPAASASLVAVPPMASPGPMGLPGLADPKPYTSVPSPPAPIPRHEEEDRQALVQAAWDEGQIELHLQTIVALPQRAPLFYEAHGFLRLADREVAKPAEIRALLRARGQVGEYDRAVLARGLAVARYLAARGSGATVALEISDATLSDPEAPALLERMVAEARPGRLVLQLSVASFFDPGAIVARLQRAGAEIALSAMPDPAALAVWPMDGPLAYMRVPAETLLAPAAAVPPNSPSHVLRRLGPASVAIVATGITREADIPDLLDLDVPLAQGDAIAPLRPVRAGILVPSAGAARPAGANGGPAPATQKGADPISLRQYLERGH